MTKKQSKVMRSFQIRMMTLIGQGTFTAVDLKNEFFVKWLVGYMAENRVPFQLVPMGGGVTRIVHSGTVCPHCEGKGFFETQMDPRPELLPEEAICYSEETPEEKKSGCGGNCTCEGGCADGGVCCQDKQKAA